MARVMEGEKLAGTGFGKRRRGLGDNGGGSWESSGSPLALDQYRLGMLLALGAISMMFAAFTSAYIFRQGTVGDWHRMDMPRILWPNTALLLLSSITMEGARRSFRRLHIHAFKYWLSVTTLLGVVFLGGQLWAWRQLAADGVYLHTNPHSSFFYMLTGVHGLHVLGGVVALFYVTLGSWRDLYIPARHTAVDLAATYWHFLGGLWVYLFLLLFVWAR